MKKIIGYDIINLSVSYGPNYLEEILKQIAAGWQPYGPPVLNDAGVLVQPVVKYEGGDTSSALEILNAVQRHFDATIAKLGITRASHPESAESVDVAISILTAYNNALFLNLEETVRGIDR
jgi:hypothetical protein